MNRCFVLILLSISLHNTLIAVNPEYINYGAFGKLTIYKPESDPKSVVLFVSGDGGWQKITDKMANSIVNLQTLVVGVNIDHYIKSTAVSKTKCLYPASDFEQLSLFIQKKYKVSSYIKPILIGYSSGATLVYGILAQAPDNTFKGVISLGFSPDILISKPLCKGKSLKQHKLKEGNSYFLEPCEKLSTPFIVMQGVNDKVCNYTVAKDFMNQLQWGEFITLPNVGHDFSPTNGWLPQFISVYERLNGMPSYSKQKEAQNKLLQAQQLNPLPGDYPITLIPSAKVDSLPLAFLISGDGGWTSFDQSLAESLAEKGLPVVGLDSQKYFWNVKTPEETTLDIAKAIEHYMIQWEKKSFILVGYSFGACVLPFVANRLPENLKDKLTSLYALSPDEVGDFEIHVADMLDLGTSPDSYNVLEEMKKVKSQQPICIFGSEEDETLRNHFSDIGIKIITLPGSHHYKDDFSRITDTIYNNLQLNNNL
ncbi:MAG: virulence factor [Bacteroidales bacterium]|nr:virulence factor [Bacteroidales bacterium]